MNFLDDVSLQCSELMNKLREILDEEKFNAMLASKKLNRWSLEEFIYSYVNYVEPYNAHLFDMCSIDEWRILSEVIDFSECSSIPQYIALINRLIRTFPHLRGNTRKKVYDNMVNELDRINRESPAYNTRGEAVPYLYLNWTPFYGGVITPKLMNAAKFRRWAIDNSVAYFADPELPVMNISEEQAYRSCYDGSHENHDRAQGSNDDGFMHGPGPVLNFPE